MTTLAIALCGLVAIVAVTLIGIGLGCLIDPILDRLESSIQWKDCE